ncbi:DUF2515 family protein [Virgibacillus kimchii]
MDTKQKDHTLLHYIINKVKKHNADNISRTDAYLKYYLQHPEIEWALVASMVSRNAGWNMTDLYLSPLQELFGKNELFQLFMTYERANWLIFSDAYPQLLIYHQSKLVNKPLFHLLRNFRVSCFMIKEWYYFWQHQDKQRLVRSLIINEQNVIQSPVVKHSFFQHHVFHRMPYLLQNIFWMSAVLLPTKNGLFGAYVHNFTNLTNRIVLGKRIASIMFHPHIYEHILDFMLTHEHTGSRKDYERFLNLSFPHAPMLRLIYPAITHKDHLRHDWFIHRGVKRKWRNKISKIDNTKIGQTFYRKRNLLFAYAHFKKAVAGRQH